MTVSYSGNLRRLLFRWKGSIWRSVYRELFAFLAMYYAIRLVYTHLIPYVDPDGEKQYKKRFERLAIAFDEYTTRIPLTFLLGFYVANVVTRWWNQFECLSWPEDLLSLLCFVIPGNDFESQKNRHRIARYLNLTSVLALRDVSSKVRCRFPSLRHVIEFGLMTETEYRQLERINEKSPGTRWLTPLHWIQQILLEEQQKRDISPGHLTSLNNELKMVRVNYRRLFCHDWVCVPLVYTQVAALATYSFFFFCLIGRQFVERDEYYIDLYFPIFSVVQFIFFVGWYKVGQDLMRPFGMDDDDIELNYILDRNLVASFTIVNTLQESNLPEFEEDPFWHRRFSIGIDLSRKNHEHPPKLHTALDLKNYRQHHHEKDRDPLLSKEEEKEKFIAW